MASTNPQQLPDKPTALRAPTSSGVIDRDGAGARRRVLIAEDDPDTLELYSWCMRAAGWHVTEAADGLEAVEAAASVQPDAIIMDLCMPGLDGRAAIARLKRDHRTRAIPVLACSGMDRARAEAQAKQAGCQAFIAKPVHPELLCALVDKLTNARPTRSQPPSPVLVIASAARTLSGLHVLVADHDADARQTLIEALESAGARCVGAGSGTEAFEWFVAMPPDMLVCDLSVPEGDGFELIRRIRALDPEHGGLTPAIGMSEEATAEQALMAGYHILLPKPIDMAVLVHTLEEFVRAERASSPEATWGIASPSPGHLEMTFAGYIAAADARTAMAELVKHLEKGPCRIFVDLRRVTGFSVAGSSLAQRAIWPKRHSIVHVTIVGGPLSARIVSTAACHALGIDCALEGSRGS